MHIEYISCFAPGDKAEQHLVAKLDSWESSGDTVVRHHVATPGELKKLIDSAPGRLLDPDILIVGGHGHSSLSGFCVHTHPVRWFDLSSLLRGKLGQGTTFFFFSCDGGYPGMSHMFGRFPGPEVAFGPRIKVLAEAAAYAVDEVVFAKRSGGISAEQGRRLIDQFFDWAKQKYPNDSYDHSFLRVTWGEGRNRYPDVPGPDQPVGDVIGLLGWGL